MDKANFSGLIDKHILDLVPAKTSINIAEIDPLNLLSFRKIDIVPKYLFAKSYLNKQNAWDEQIYKNHLWLWNNFKENSGEDKKKYSDFVSSFKSTIDSIEELGFNPTSSIIPVSINNTPLNGSHRIAAAIALKKPVFIAKLPIDCIANGFDFFSSKHMDVTQLDYLALNYAMMKKNTFVAVVFPIIIEKIDESKEIIRKKGSIVYEKQIMLNANGMQNLIHQMYKNEPWIMNENKKNSGIATHVLKRYVPGKPITILLVESDGETEMREAKNEIREMFNFGNFPVHIGDTHEETILLARQVFNENGVDFLNMAEPKVFNTFGSYFSKYKSWAGSKANTCHCIDSSSVMAAFGLRDVKDLDFLSLDEIDCPDNGINNHNKEAEHYETSIKTIIENPHNHFSYDGAKFTSIKILYKMKKKRAGYKDQNDLILIKSALFGNHSLRRRALKVYYDIIVALKSNLLNFGRRLPKPLYSQLLAVYHFPGRIKKFHNKEQP